jgi:hypothetical protein
MADPARLYGFEVRVRLKVRRRSSGPRPPLNRTADYW